MHHFRHKSHRTERNCSKAIELVGSKIANRKPQTANRNQISNSEIVSKNLLNRSLLTEWETKYSKFRIFRRNRWEKADRSSDYLVLAKINCDHCCCSRQLPASVNRSIEFSDSILLLHFAFEVRACCNPFVVLLLSLSLAVTFFLCVFGIWHFGSTRCSWCYKKRASLTASARH